MGTTTTAGPAPRSELQPAEESERLFEALSGLQTTLQALFDGVAAPFDRVGVAKAQSAAVLDRALSIADVAEGSLPGHQARIVAELRLLDAALCRYQNGLEDVADSMRSALDHLERGHSV